MICENYLSPWLGINGTIRLLVSLLSAPSPFPMICLLIRLLYTLIVHLLAAM